MINCNLCIIAVVFLIANIYTIITCTNNSYKQDFKNLLTKEQNLIYEKIINERKQIYYYGYVLGIILSLIVLLFLIKVSKIKINNISIMCIVGSITFVTNYLYYILYPTDYMLLHLNDKNK